MTTEEMLTPSAPVEIAPPLETKLEDRAIALMREMFQTELARMEQLSDMMETSRNTMESMITAVLERLKSAAELLEEALTRVDKQLTTLEEVAENQEMSTQLLHQHASSLGTRQQLEQQSPESGSD